jgi:hypothetical protein
MMTLEEALSIHLENERKWIRPQNNPLVNRHTEMHIKIITEAPRNSKKLKKLIEDKKWQIEKSMTRDVTSDLVCELFALQRLHAMVSAAERGQPMEHYAY